MIFPEKQYNLSRTQEEGRRRREPEFQDIMEYDSQYMTDASFRNMLDNICPKCYVETAYTRQSGTVESVIRDKRGIPVCLKVRYGKQRSIDYISVDRVCFWEPYDSYIPDESYWTQSEDDDEFWEACCNEDNDETECE